MDLFVVDIELDEKTRMSFGDVMKKYGLSYENTKYYAQTGQLFDGKYYLEGLGGDPIPPDDYWSRR